MKTHSWVSYNHFGDSIEITIRDHSGGKIEGWKVGSVDKKRQKQVFSVIKKKYGIDLFFKVDTEQDLNWLE